MDARIHMGSCMLVTGPILSGKTSFFIRLMDSAHVLFDIVPTYVYWFYGQKTEAHDLLTRKGFIMHEGLPENFDFCEPNSVIVLDDLMEETRECTGNSVIFKSSASRTLFYY